MSICSHIDMCMGKARDAAEQQRIKQQEAKDLAFLQLMTEKEKLKEDAVLERWRGYTTRLDRQEKTLCIIKDDIALMKDKHHDKVDWKHCHAEMEKFDLRLRNGEATA